jgi:hypothetical protein
MKAVKLTIAFPSKPLDVQSMVLKLSGLGRRRNIPHQSLPKPSITPLTNHLGEAVLQQSAQATTITLGSRIALRIIAFFDISTNPQTPNKLNVSGH